MFLSFLMLMLLGFCSCRDTITIWHAIKDGRILISREGNFALGFFSPGKSSSRYLGIWFYKVSIQTVVWVANRDNPINGSSGVLSINRHGNLVLYENHHQTTAPFWSTNASVTGSSVAHLLDSGNFILVQNESNTIVWQSFDYPTDIQLPGMKLGLDRKTGLQRFLTSWKSADDPGTGDYSFKLNAGGGAPQFFLYKGSAPYWRSIPYTWRSFPEDINLSFSSSEDEIYTSYSPVDTSTFKMTQIGPTGSFKRYSWQTSNSQWKEIWSPLLHQCTYGQCGAFSKCTDYDLDIFQCACLPTYEPKFPKKWSLRDGSGGCVRKDVETSYSSLCGKGEWFVKLTSLTLPDVSVAWADMSGRECQHICLENCSCTGYAIIESRRTCLVWHGELMDMVEVASRLGDIHDFYIRVGEIESDMRKSKGSLGRKAKLRILVLSVASSWLVLMILFSLWLKKRRARKSKRNVRLWDHIRGGSDYYNELGEAMSLPGVAFFTPSIINAATNNFSPANKIGQGGFGSVYKGQLSNGQEIAVKRLCKNSGQGLEEFKTEVLLIAKLQHRNLVKLIGCCIHGEEPMLIYEYLPNKSLDAFLFDETRRALLNWRNRFDIIFGIARGLLYLHQDSRLRIIHRDLKSSNILLDADMNAKISDFGMARIFKGDQIQDKTRRVVGTYGYMAPEYAVFGKFSVKSDVFSFGVILLEIIVGKKSNGFYQEDASLSLIGHVWRLWREERALDVIDSSLNLSYCSDEALRCIQIGLLCVQEDAMERPTMSAVVLMLNGEKSLPCPNKPAFLFRKSYRSPTSPTTEHSSCSINDVTITTILTR